MTSTSKTVTPARLLEMIATRQVELTAPERALLEKIQCTPEHPDDYFVAAQPPISPTASYCVIDIETADAPEEAVEAAAQSWKAPSNWGEEAAENGRKKHMAKLASGAALLDHAPIICVGIATNRERIVFHAMAKALEFKDETWACIPCDASEEVLMLHTAQYLLEVAGEETVLAGHGVARFDLPKLRNAMARHNVALPPCLAVRNRYEVFDFEHKLKYFSAEHSGNKFPSFGDVMRCLGIWSHKGLVTGADVPKLYRAGEHEAILRYNLLDIINEETAYKMMSGE